MPDRHPTRRLPTALRWIGLGLFALLPLASPAATILSNGKVKLGVNDQGHLIYGGIGLTFAPSNQDVLTPGCDCEGWGVADVTSGAYGKAGRNFGIRNLVVESFTTADGGATSVVQVVAGASALMRVTHAYRPSVSNSLYHIDVKVENIGTAPIDLRYRRAMDWDVYPNVFNEMVTLLHGDAPYVHYTSDNGFADGNPLVGAGSYLFVGEAVDSGPYDHGAVFDFAFGPLAPGASQEFVLYYGAAQNQDEAMMALAAVGAEAYSLGKPNPNYHGLSDASGNPNTYIFGYRSCP